MSEREWDIHYIGLAEYCSRKSKDPSTKTGAAIVRPDRSLCSTGFNGFPQCMSDDPELYADREEKYSRIVHSEMNAFVFSHDSSVRGYTLYVWPFTPCDRCAVLLLQAGITRFVWPEPSIEKLARWGKSFARTKKYLAEAEKKFGVKWFEIPAAELPEDLRSKL